LAGVICSDNQRWGRQRDTSALLQAVVWTRKRFITLTKSTSGCFECYPLSDGIWTSVRFRSIVRGDFGCAKKFTGKQPCENLNVTRFQ
jgi:hypothetical protein